MSQLKSMCFISSVFLFACFCLCPLHAGAGDRAFIDAIEFGNAESEGSHQFTLSGNVVVETLDTEMGSFADRYVVHTLKGRNSSLSLHAARLTAGEMLLEIQEIHNRRPDAFGYTVLVNDEPAYFRTYEEYGAGPNHYFIKVPAARIGGGERMKVTFRSEGGAPFSLGRMWVYANFFDTVAVQEDVYRKMGLVIPFELMKTQEQRAAYQHLKNYSPIGLLSFAGYSSGSVAANRKSLGNKLKLSAETGMPILLVVNGTGWGGKPNGPDGLGGYFSDARYSIVNYSQSTRSYRPSWPGMWGSISTPTLRDPQLNDYLEKRFVHVFGDLRGQLDGFVAAGTPSQPWLIREFAPISGEVSNYTIASAKEKGTDLDPADGLTLEERLFMHRDATRAWQDWADSTVRVVGRESVLIDKGVVKLPSEQMLDNLYSHPDFLGAHPVNDPRWCGGQMGMVKGLWSSGEMGRGNEYRDIAMYDYVRARGKLAMINMERTILKQDFSVVKNHYARGFQFVCLFNAYDGDAELVKTVDGIDHQPSLPAVHREPSILDLNFRRNGNPGNEGVLMDSRNMKVRGGGLAVEDVMRPGHVTYRLDNVGEPFVSSLNLHLNGRVSPGAANRIEVHAGVSPDALTQLAILTAAELPCPDHWTPWMTSEISVDLGEAMVGKKAYYLRLVFNAAGAPDAAFLISLHVGSQWARKSGHVGGSPFAIRESRITQLWVQDRVLAERWLQQYRAIGGEDDVYDQASELFDNGWYRSAYKLLSGEISQLLPARYVVRGAGRLGRYPIEVAMSDPSDAAAIVLEHVDDDAIQFSVTGFRGDGQEIKLHFPDLNAKGNWRVVRLGDDRYRLEKVAGASSSGSQSGLSILHRHEEQTETGARRFNQSVQAPEQDAPATPGTPEQDAPATPGTPEQDAPATLVLNVAASSSTVAEPKLPREFKGRCTGVKGRRIWVDCQDLELMQFNESLELTLAKDAGLSRVPHNPAFPEAVQNAQDGPNEMDMVELTIDEQGMVTSAKSIYGYDKGTIESFDPPVLVGELSNGIIELENGNRYELNFGKKTGTKVDMVALSDGIMNYELAHLEDAFKPGQQVEIRYCPYTYGNGLPRMISIKQENQILFEENFAKTEGDEWRQRAVSVDGLDVTPHKPEPNYLYKVIIRLLRPTQHFVPGSVIYRIDHDKPLKTTAVEFAARAFEDSSRVTCYVSDDQKSWTKCGQFDNTWQNNISQVLGSLPLQFIDLTPAVQGRKEFFLKVELAVNSADERFCLSRLRVVTEAE